MWGFLPHLLGTCMHWVPNMLGFIDANNLQPFTGEDLMGVLETVEYTDLNGKDDSGCNSLNNP